MIARLAARRLTLGARTPVRQSIRKNSDWKAAIENAPAGTVAEDLTLIAIWGACLYSWGTIGAPFFSPSGEKFDYKGNLPRPALFGVFQFPNI